MHFLGTFNQPQLAQDQPPNTHRAAYSRSSDSRACSPKASALLSQASPQLRVTQRGSSLELCSLSPVKEMEPSKASRLPQHCLFNSAGLPNTHARSDTTLIKDIAQSYQFVAALRDSSEDGLPSQVDFSVGLAGTLDSVSREAAPENSLNSGLRPFQGEKHRLSRSDLTQGDTMDLAADSCPARMYCPVCKKSVGTLVHHEPQQVPFWRRLFCNDCLRKTTRYTVMHSCRYCRLVLQEYKCSV